MLKLSIILAIAFFLAVASTIFVDANEVTKTTVVDGMRIELHVLPAEPFFTADEVKIKKMKEGMLIISGAEPVSVEANTHPNRHLVVHIFDVKTDKAITTAKVTMKFQQLDSNGKLIGASTDVPIVVMEAIGKGVESTHYGNNVVMPEGSYAITVVANGKKADFQVVLSKEEGMDSHKMHMD
jgi:hypothetical protein